MFSVLCGARAWMIYAVIEYFTVCVAPWILTPSYQYEPLHAGFTAFLFVAYPLIGSTVLGLVALLLNLAAELVPVLRPLRAAGTVSSLATLSVVGCYTANVVRNLGFTGPVRTLVLLSSILALALVISALSKTWGGRLSWFSNPWTSNFLLLGLAYVTLGSLRESLPAATNGIASGYIVTVLLLSLLAWWRNQASVGVSPASAIRSFARLAVVAPCLVVGALFLKQQPLQELRNRPVGLTNEHTPNVVIITLDTVRADHLSIYGYARNTSPNLGRIHEEATLYTRAVSTASSTLPAHASMFTGLHTIRHGAHPSLDFPAGRPLQHHFQTLAELLSQNGYATAAVVANHGSLGPALGLARGFQHYDARFPVTFLGWVNEYTLRQAVRNVSTLFARPVDYDIVCRRAAEINSAVFELLAGFRQNPKKFFLFVNYMDAHWPYIPPPPFNELFPGRVETFNLAKYFRLRERVLKLEGEVTREEQNHLLSQYDGGIAYLDQHLGQLIGKLKSLGLYDNTLIIIAGDHGEAFGERNLFEHGVSVYQDQVHIPLLIKYPGQQEPSTIQAPVCVTDLMPTILDALDAKVSRALDGSSLLRIPIPDSRPIYSETYPLGFLRNWHSRFKGIERAVFLGRFKFIRSTLGKQELYDLSADPGETTNLHRTDSPISGRLAALLEEYVRTGTAFRGSGRKLDPATLKSLKSLGYIQ